jgi:hypothetical protein
VVTVPVTVELGTLQRGIVDRGPEMAVTCHQVASRAALMLDRG